ncbi:MAG: glycosyltransferase family 2 protein [Alphaproteobacteria bacterium]|nr:glycosyltransferase family 2 protein [Alphaproteobacteria bacterium]
MTSNRPLVSVVTANFNGARHLPAAIRSILEQTLANLELIVVDDASSDESAEIIQSAAVGDPRVRLIVQPQNAGPGAARNRGLAAATGRYIAVFDSDDLMAPDRLQRLVARAESDQADIVADNLLAFDDAAPEADRPFLPAASFREARWVGAAELIASSRMYSRHPGLGYVKPLIGAAALRTAGVRYDETLRIGEDYDFLLRLLAKGLRLRLEPAALYRYRRHPASISHALRRDHLQAMLRADAAFDADFPDLPDDVRRAQAARRRSLERALGYDEVITRLKARDLAGGIGAALGRPAVWPLLTMPVTARLKRLAGRLQPA